MAKEPLLNLSTFFDREHVLIDAKPYEFRNKDELSILDFEALSAHGKRIGNLSSNDQDLSEADIKEVEHLSSSALKRIFVSIPDDVIERLTLIQRTTLISVFTNLLRALMPSGETGVQTSEPRIGG